MIDGYVVMENDRWPLAVFWTHQEAINFIATEKAGRPRVGLSIIAGVPIATLVEPMRSYFTQRGYKFPDTNQAFLFLASEIGELADRLVQSQSDEWVRNHPENKSGEIKGEIADVLMMTIALCAAAGLDPIETMFDKWRAKGWREK